MCDYSLEHYHSRPAQQDEDYVTNRFTSGSVGFIVPGDPSIAICVACDMRLALAGIPPPLQSRLGISGCELVTFTRLETGLYRDGVRFANGQAVTLQELGSGVTARLFDALAKPIPAFGTQRQARLETV